MNTTTDTTVQTFSISDSDEVRVDRCPSGDFVVRLIVNGSMAQERWAFGSHEAIALRNGKAWAASMRADRAWMARQVLTLIEAAEQLGLSPTTLRVQIRNGKLSARKVGRDWTVSEKAVEKYRTERKRHAARSRDAMS